MENKIATVVFLDGTTLDMHPGAMETTNYVVIGVVMGTKEGIIIPMSAIKYITDGQIHEDLNDV